MSSTRFKNGVAVTYVYTDKATSNNLLAFTTWYDVVATVATPLNTYTVSVSV